MDGFKYTVMIEALQKDPLQIPLDTFEDSLLALSKEDLDELFEILNTDKIHDIHTANHIMKLLQALWHYR